eukprot:Em0012g336a
MESTNHGEGPVAASKRRYIPLNDVLPPLETLVVAIEGSVDPDGVCCLSIPNRVLGDWANNREKNTSFVALANEYIVDEAITLNPEAARLEDLLYRKSLGVVSKRAKRSYLYDLNEEADAFIEGLQEEVQDLKDALSEAQDSQNNPGESLKVHTTSGKTFHIPFSDDAASENEDTVDLRVLYILDRYGLSLQLFQEIDGLQQLGFVAVNGVSYNIELFFSSDMKFMLTMLGLNAANSIYACPKCTVHRDCRWDVSKPESYYSTTMARTLVTLRRAFASHGRTAAVHQGSVNRPLTAIPVDHMMIDELHLFLRIFDVMLRNLIKMSEPHTQQLVAYIRSCGVSFNIWESESSDGKLNGHR